MRRVDGIEKRKLQNFLDELPTASSSTKRKGRLNFSIIILILVLVTFATTVADQVSNLTTLGRLVHTGKYLVLFQNNAELRPTGGFLGSFGVFEVSRGRIKNYRVEGNIYQADNEFIKTHKIAAPTPFQKIWPNSFMAFNSANWSPDFSTAALQIQWYYEQEYQDKVDGVFAINSTAVARLLELTAPVKLSQYSMTFDGKNFLAQIQQFVEKDYYQDLANQNLNQPKAILSELLGVIIARLPATNPIKLAKLIEDSLASHEVQLSFNEQAKQAVVEKRGWSLEIPHWNGNYFYINNANLGGGKGSLGVLQDIDYEVASRVDGSDAILSITRSNQGRLDYPVSDNLNFTRVLVPAGSKLNYVNLDGLDITSAVTTQIDLERTIFGFWFDTAVGQSKQAILSYQVPPTSDARLLIQHQPGSPEDTIKVVVEGQTRFEGKLRSSRIFDIL